MPFGHHGMTQYDFTPFFVQILFCSSFVEKYSVVVIGIRFAFKTSTSKWFEFLINHFEWKSFNKTRTFIWFRSQTYFVFVFCLKVIDRNFFFRNIPNIGLWVNGKNILWRRRKNEPFDNNTKRMKKRTCCLFNFWVNTNIRKKCSLSSVSTTATSVSV